MLDQHAQVQVEYCSLQARGLRCMHDIAQGAVIEEARMISMSDIAASGVEISTVVKRVGAIE